MEEKNGNAAPECRKNNDLRTFFIALLTAIVVVALYHFGCGLYKIFCSDCCSNGYYPTQRYMLVPVMDMPMMPGMGERHGHRHGHGKFGMRKPGFRDGGMKPEWKRGPGFKGKRPDGQFGPKGFKGPRCMKKPGENAPEAAPAPAAKPAPEAKPVPAAKPAPAPAK